MSFSFGELSLHVNIDPSPEPCPRSSMWQPRPTLGALPRPRCRCHSPWLDAMALDSVQPVPGYWGCQHGGRGKPFFACAAAPESRSSASLIWWPPLHSTAQPYFSLMVCAASLSAAFLMGHAGEYLCLGDVRGQHLRHRQQPCGQCIHGIVPQQLGAGGCHHNGVHHNVLWRRTPRSLSAIVPINSSKPRILIPILTASG